MGKSVAEVVVESRREDLRLIFEPPKRTSMNHAVAVALKIVSVGMREFGITAPPALLDRKPEMRESAGHHGRSTSPGSR